MQQRTVNFQMCLKSGDGNGTYGNWRQKAQDSWCHDAESLGMEIGPCHQLTEQQLTEGFQSNKLVDDNEASHVDKLVVMFSEVYMYVFRAVL